MNNLISTLILACFLCWPQASLARSPCTTGALVQAKKLLTFHADGDERVDILPEIKELPSLLNPADKKQTFQVLEVWGHIYKGTYRMRLIYYALGHECQLMGQEVLEMAKL